MTPLNEQELFAQLHLKKESSVVTYEEISNPNYQVWGRARLWKFHQAVCLISGFNPLKKEYYDLIIQMRTPLSSASWCKHYPITEMDRNRLQNVHHWVMDIYGQPQVVPKHLLDASRFDFPLYSIIPEKLKVIIEQFGPHASLNLPDTFDSLESNPELFEDVEKWSIIQIKNDLKPIPNESLTQQESKESVISKEGLLSYDLRRYRDEQLARLIARAAAAILWKQYPKMSLKEILRNTLFQQITNAFCKLMFKTDGFTTEIIENWIRDLNPNYRPRKK